MNVSIADFLPYYPDFDNDVQEILGGVVVNDSLEAEYDIYRKKEFHDKKLSRFEKKPKNPGDLLNHQIILARFLSSHTQYKGVLVFHAVGTGKTTASVAVVEQIRNEGKTSFTGAVVIMKGQGLIKNYKDELVFRSTKGQYIPENYASLPILQKIRRIDKKLSEFYEFDTFEMFSKKISGMSDSRIIKEYSNKIIIIDEAHNLRSSESASSEESTQYNNIHRFLHTVLNCKTILLTGTPMRDGPEEISSIMNLILPEGKQLPIGQEFADEFLEKDGDHLILRNDKSQELKKYFYGRISYLSAMKSTVKHVFVGEPILKYFNLYQVGMSKFQEKSYSKAYKMDSGDRKGIYSNTTQASLLVYPDGSWGAEGFKKYFIESKKSTGKIRNERMVMKKFYAVSKDFFKVFENKTTKEKLQVLREMSCKYADCIEKILELDRENHFVFLDLVEGSGAIVLSEIFKIFGIQSYAGGTVESLKKGPRFALITGSTSPEEIRKILNLQSSPLNMNGEYLRVIIGTKAVSEGYTFKNIQSEYILTPHWNFTRTEQAIARGIRYGSHDDLVKSGATNILVKIYLYSIKAGSDKSIDEIMYKFSEDKDVSIKSIEHAMKEASFDCALNRERNILPDAFDNYRECDYTSCDYECDHIPLEEIENPDIDISTYNLFYDNDEINVIMGKINNIFDKVVRINFKDLLKILRKDEHQDFIILKALKKMISTNFILKNSLGYNYVLRNDSDCIYATFNLLSNSNFFDNFYVENFSLQERSDFDKEVVETYSKNLPVIFRKMREEKDLVKKKGILRKFSLSAQELMLELAIKSSKLNINSCVDIREFIIDNFKAYIKNIDNVVVSTMIFDKSGVLRCFDKEWGDCEKKYETKIAEIIEEKIANLEENPYGYYGIYETQTGKFYIRDISKKEQKGNVDDRKITSGVVCKTSWNRDQLIKLVDIMKLEYDSEEYKDKNTKEKLMEYLDDKKYKDVAKAYSKQELAKKSLDDIKRILYWGKLKKEPICNRIQKWFEDNNLMEIVVSKKK